VDTSKVSNFINPATAGDLLIGTKVGSMKQYNFLCEDALFFRQPLIYSLKAKTRTLLWRCKKAMLWPEEVMQDLRLQSLVKYQWLLQRIDRVEQQLGEVGCYGELQMAKQIEEKAKKNNPSGNKIIC
jgi:hypothetical protein